MQYLLKYKLVIRYNGANYSGWQYQRDNPNTIQNKLTTILIEFTNDYKLTTGAVSRTDKGVHALEQVVQVLTVFKGMQLFINDINLLLPNDISIKTIDLKEPNYSIYKDIISKEYHYHFGDKNLNDSQDKAYKCFTDLDISKMQKACKLFEGKNDFVFFTTPKIQKLKILHWDWQQIAVNVLKIINACVGHQLSAFQIAQLAH